MTQPLLTALLKRAQSVNPYGIGGAGRITPQQQRQEPVIPDLSLTDAELNADGGGGWQDQSGVLPTSEAIAAKKPVAGSTAIPVASPPVEPPAPPDLPESGNVAMDAPGEGTLGDAFVAQPKPKAESNFKTMLAGVPSSALWAAGGVGAAGLLGYLLSRKRRGSRQAG